MLYMGPEQSSVEPTLSPPTPEEYTDFERRAKGFQAELTLLSQKYGVVVSLTDENELGLVDMGDDRLLHSDLGWDGETRAYRRWEWDNRNKRFRWAE